MVNLNVNTNGGLTFPRRWYKWTRNALPLAEPPTPYFYLEHIPQTGDRYMLYAIAAERADTVKACLLITEHPEPPPVPAAEVQNWAYPNPVGAGGRHITIEPQGSQPIEIYSAGGLKVREYPASAPKTTIDVTGLPAGAYMVRQGSRTAVVVVQ